MSFKSLKIFTRYMWLAGHHIRGELMFGEYAHQENVLIFMPCVLPSNVYNFTPPRMVFQKPEKKSKLDRIKPFKDLY